MSYGVNSKKIMFYDTDKRHAELKIRLQHDSLKQSEFFRAVVTAYIEKDELLLEFINQYKEENKVQSKERIEKSKKSNLLGFLSQKCEFFKIGSPGRDFRPHHTK